MAAVRLWLAIGRTMTVAFPVPERPLLPLESRPLDNQNISPEHTLLWYFEAELKVRFSRLVEQLATALKDTVADFRRFGLECVAELLSGKAEEVAKK